MIETYEEAVTYIGSIPKFTSKTSLAHTRRFLEQLGHPEREQKILHVAGTNGKGSVCAALDAMLRAGGYRVGLFTSPHLIRLNERFRIQGEPVGDEAFLRAFRQVMQATETLRQEGEAHPTFFETVFLMGMVLFREAGVDYTVLEVGMGGRLDATNAVDSPLVSVITSVSLDHTQYLGETLPEIAGEKAGIIKPGIPVVYDAYDPAVNAVIEQKAKAVGSPAYPLTRGRSRRKAVTEKGTVFGFREEDGDESELRIPQMAPYQMTNAALAWYTLRKLETEIPLFEADKKSGLASLDWPCRMQAVEPDIYIDGAHNPDGIAACIEAVRAIRNGRQVTLLFSAVQDKQYTAMIRELAAGIRPEQVVTTRIQNVRAASEEELAALFRQNGCPSVVAVERSEDAWKAALSRKKDGLLLCVGSLYLAGELLEIVQRTEQKPGIEANCPGG